MACPATSRITSPFLMPACAAGPPGTTSVTYTPPVAGLQLRVMPQLRVAGRRVIHARVREALVVVAIHVLEEMRDDRRGQHVHRLGARIITHQDTRQLAVFCVDDRGRETSLAVLQRQTEPVDEKRGAFELVVRHLNGRDGAGGGHQRVVAFELEHVDAVADHGVERQVKRFEPGEKIVRSRLEKGEVGFVVHTEHLGIGALAALGAFQFDEAVVGNQLRRDQHPVARQHRAETVKILRVLFGPGTEEIVVLVRHVDTDDGQPVFGHGAFGGGRGRGGPGQGNQRRRQSNEQKSIHESKERED